jgi:hypothetical protein
MGTTIVASLFYDNKLTVADIGDSRVYRFRDNVLSRSPRITALYRNWRIILWSWLAQMEVGIRFRSFSSMSRSHIPLSPGEDCLNVL